MSRRAYRVVKIMLADSSFDVSHDQKLINFMESEIPGGFYSCLNSFGSGAVDVPVAVLKKAVKVARKLDLDDETVKRLKQDLSFAKSSNNESVTYSCF